MMIIFLIFGFVVSFVYSETLHADISIPFSSTFKCDEQDQSTPGWVNCDGLSKAGDHPTDEKRISQITEKANFTMGLGGLGHRYWIGPGRSNNSGGIDFNFKPQTELYVRWYVRWQKGFKLDDSQKMLYFSFGQNIYFDMGDNLTAIRVVVDGNPSTIQGWGWNQLSDGDAAANVSDESWHCTEIHVKRVPGSNNDIAEWWFDGVKRLQVNNLNFSSDFFQFGAPANQTADITEEMWNDTDDFVVQTTGPIGCISPKTPTPSTPPVPPKNLKAN